MKIQIILPRFKNQATRGYLAQTFPIKPEDKLIFLAGPVVGGGLWQNHMIQAIMDASLLESNGDGILYITVPYGENRLAENLREKLLPYVTKGGHMIEFETICAWERHYIELAIRHGRLVFWLPHSEPDFDPYKKVYGEHTRGEFPIWTLLSKQVYQDCKPIIVGGTGQLTENNGQGVAFPGIDTMIENHSLNFLRFPNINSLDICHTMQQVAKKILQL